MSKSIAELRASKSTALPERSYTICLAQALVAEVQSLHEERAEIPAPKRDGDEGRPRRKGESAPARVKEIDARLEELFEEMREHTGELRLRGKNAGEWRRWADAHPAREDNSIDEDAAYGYCNASDLLETLGEYAVAYNGDELAEGDWDFIANRAAPGDLKELCRIVVQMHEVGGSKAPGKSQSASSATQTSATD